MRCLLACLLFAAAAPSGETPLFSAAQEGKYDDAKRLMGDGAQVNQANGSGLTALHAAALANQTDMIVLLLSQGADPTARTTHSWAYQGRIMPVGSTPLQAASLWSHKASMATLHRALDAGVCAAVKAKQATRLEPLLKAGGNAQQRHCGEGDGPLTAAALSGQLDLATLLLDNGADATDTGGPLRRAFEGGSADMLKLLLQRKADVKAAWHGRDFLPYTWRERDVANFKLLVEAGLSPNTPGADTMTPFHHVARNAELVRYVLAHGGNANVATSTGFGVLHAACLGNDVEPVRLLLDAGAKIDAQQDDGLTPLARACASGSNEVVKLLLQRGADVKTRSKDGTGLATWAALAGNPTLIQTVVAAGAPVDATDDDGSTALHWVSQEAAVKALLALGADVKHADHGGQTPLHRAAARENGNAVIALLLAHGADVNALDSDGEAPLHLAHASNITTLLKAHADIALRDRQGRTPLLAQLEQGDEGAVALLEAGADARAVDAHGLTALHWAAIGNAAHSAQLLLKRGLDVNALTKSVFHYKTDEVDRTFPAASTPFGLCDAEADDDEDVAKTLSAAGGKKR